MRRIRLILSVALVMAAIVVASAAPAFAKPAPGVPLKAIDAACDRAENAPLGPAFCPPDQD